MTVANRLTLTRLAMVPAFMIFMFTDTIWTRLAALIIFIIASLTDWYDGKLARETGTVTVVGMFLDPLVDKMLIAAALVGFVEIPEIHVPAWMVVLIISREFLITGLRSLAASRGIILAAEGAGKFKMVSQITAIITIFVILVANDALVRWPALRPDATGTWGHVFYGFLDGAPFWLILAATIFTIVSGAIYIRRNMDLLRREFAMLNTLRER